jgi:hypothetical protein
MVFGERVIVYCENHTEHTDALCGQNVEFWCVKAGGTYSDHWALKDLVKNDSRLTSYHKPHFISVSEASICYPRPRQKLPGMPNELRAQFALLAAPFWPIHVLL